MKTTLTKGFEKNFLCGLAGVGKRRSRKQMINDIVDEAAGGVDMAKGLQGRGDWHGAAARVVSAAGLVDQAIDLAETLPGVEFAKTREQAQLVMKRLSDTMPKLDIDPQIARQQVTVCEDALLKAIEVMRMFVSSLRDDIVVKDGQKFDFNESLLIKSFHEKVEKAKKGEKEKPGFLTGEKKPAAKGPASAGDKFLAIVNPLKAAGVDTEKFFDECLRIFAKMAKCFKESKKGVEKAAKGKKLKPGSLKGGKSEPAAKAPIGSGERFQALVSQLEAKGIDFYGTLDKAAVRDPKALAAAIGRAKYGKKRFQEMAAAGRRKASK